MQQLSTSPAPNACASCVELLDPEHIEKQQTIESWYSPCQPVQDLLLGRFDSYAWGGEQPGTVPVTLALLARAHSLSHHTRSFAITQLASPAPRSHAVGEGAADAAERHASVLGHGVARKRE